MILLRACNGFDELQACVQLQIDVWGYADGDVIPRRVFLVAQKIGGQVLGAFDAPDSTHPDLTQPDSTEPDSPEAASRANLVGFALALPGIKPTPAGPVTYLHSHMLAVRNDYRNQGIGRRLKLAQREDALRRGIRHMEWTFDPLEIKNAYLNLHRLGAIVRRYEPNFYGSSSSRLQGGLPTDRLVAEWQMDSPRVCARLAHPDPAAAADPAANPKPAASDELLVPAAIYQWKADEASRPLAADVQTRNRERLQSAFRSGLAIVDYRLDPDGSGRFALGHYPQPDPEVVAARSVAGHSVAG